jgi:hypothetical protein
MRNAVNLYLQTSLDPRENEKQFIVVHHLDVISSQQAVAKVEVVPIFIISLILCAPYSSALSNRQVAQTLFHNLVQYTHTASRQYEIDNASLNRHSVQTLFRSLVQYKHTASLQYAFESAPSNEIFEQTLFHSLVQCKQTAFRQYAIESG